MRINKKWFLPIFLSLISPSFNIEIIGQNADSFVDSSDYYLEQLVINTDRDVYITGEQVMFKVYKLDGSTGNPAGLSKIVYVELLDALNNPLNQVKIMIEGHSGLAAFRLSDTLSSGNYLIRAYTGWMQNFSEDLFSYNTITVINPFRNISDLADAATGQADENSLLYTGTDELTRNKTDEDHIRIKTIPDKNKYGPRERVKIDISVYGSEGNPANADLSVSVVKSFLTTSDRKYPVDQKVNDCRINDPSDFPVHLPELEGELIRGVIFNKTTYEPLKDTDISLSFVGKKARCQFMKTNSEGEFIFVVKDQSGPAEIVIQPLSPDISGSYVELYQSFCNTYNEFRPPVFRIDSNLTVAINNAIISMQVNNLYEQEMGSREVPADIEINDFFGNSVRAVNMADYIELVNIREVVKEILPEVTLFRIDRQPALKVISSNPYQIFEDPALVLFDGVPVYEIEKLLEVSSKELERIEIINSRYFYADYVFEGIISFISKKGDLNSIESDKSVFRQVIDGCLEQKNFYSPDYSNDSARLNRIPDFRNTLYWKPDIITSEDGTATVEFYTSDEEMEYTIITEGITSDGKRVYYTAPLIVN